MACAPERRQSKRSAIERANRSFICERAIVPHSQRFAPTIAQQSGSRIKSSPAADRLSIHQFTPSTGSHAQWLIKSR
jgi:hypothetical protein